MVFLSLRMPMSTARQETGTGLIDATLEEVSNSRLLAIHPPLAFLVLCLCVEKGGVISPWVAWISGGWVISGGGL